MKARALVQQAYEKYAKRRVDARRSAIFTDIACSPRWNKSTVNELPCLTAARGSSRGYWVSTRGRKISISELCRFQGLSPSAVKWDRHGISACRAGHMLGNTMSLNVIERIFARVLYSTGLVENKLPDRWESATHLSDVL